MTKIYNHKILWQIVVRHPRRKQPIQSETDPSAGGTMTEVQEGEMIAVYLPQYRDELPTIGKVVSINEEGAKVEVEWYVGSYTGV